jgi:hypothetical protein
MFNELIILGGVHTTSFFMEGNMKWFLDMVKKHIVGLYHGIDVSMGRKETTGTRLSTLSN